MFLRVYVRPQGGEGVSCSLIPGLWSQVLFQGEGEKDRTHYGQETARAVRLLRSRRRIFMLQE